jgi:hypothetical protein
MVSTNLVHNKGIVYTNFRRECYWYVNRIVRVLALHAEGLGHPARIYIRETEEAAVANSRNTFRSTLTVVRRAKESSSFDKTLKRPLNC